MNHGHGRSRSRVTVDVGTSGVRAAFRCVEVGGSGGPSTSVGWVQGSLEGIDEYLTTKYTFVPKG